MKILNNLFYTKEHEWIEFKDKKAIIYAKSVKDMANKYRKQLTLCKKNLDKNKYIIF